MSQSIRSDRISESTIARIAGNLLSGQFTDSELADIAREGLIGPGSDDVIEGAVWVARGIASAVERTRPKEDEGFGVTDLRQPPEAR